MRPVILLALLAVPLAVGGSVDGAEVCEIAATLLCTRAMTADAGASVGYTQQTLACDATSCTYAPTAHISLDVEAPGTWVLRASTYATHYPSGMPIAGSKRALECAVEGPMASCSDAEASVEVVGSPVTSARWHATWVLVLVDPLGEEHVQGAWSGQGWLAQYCRCG